MPRRDREIGERREERRTERGEDLDRYIASLPPGLRDQYESLRQRQRQDVIKAGTEGWDRKHGLVPGAPGSMTSKSFGESRTQLAERDELQLAYTKLAVALEKYETDLAGKRATAKTSKTQVEDAYTAIAKQIIVSFYGAEEGPNVARIGAEKTALAGEEKRLDALLKKHLGDVQLPGESVQQIGNASEAWRRAVSAQQATKVPNRGKTPQTEPRWNDFSATLQTTLDGLNVPQREAALLLIAQNTGETTDALWKGAIYDRKSQTQKSLTEMKKKNDAEKSTRAAQIEQSLQEVDVLKKQLRRTGWARKPEDVAKLIKPAMAELGLTQQGNVLLELGKAIQNNEHIDTDEVMPHLEIILAAASGVPVDIAKKLQAEQDISPKGAPRTAESTIWEQFAKYESDPLDPGQSQLWRELEQTDGYKSWVKAREYEGSSLDFIRRAFIREMKALKRSANMKARAKEAATILSGARPASPGEKVRAAIRSQLNPYYLKGRGATEGADSAALTGAGPGEDPVDGLEDERDPVEALKDEEPDLTAAAEQEEETASQTLTDDKGETFTKDSDETIITEEGDKIEPESEAGQALENQEGWEDAGEGEGATLEDQAAEELPEEEDEELADEVDAGEVGQAPKSTPSALDQAIQAANADAEAAQPDEEAAADESMRDQIDKDLGDAKRKSQERQEAGDPAGDVEDPMRKYLPGHIPDVDMEGSDVLQSGPPEESTPPSGMGVPGIKMDLEDAPLGGQQGQSPSGGGEVFTRLNALEAKKREIDLMLEEAKKRAGGVGESLAPPNISGATATPVAGKYFGREGELRKKRASSDTPQ